MLTHDNLMKRGFVMASRCCLCNCAFETVSHLFLHCPVSAELWGYFLDRFGLSWATLDSKCWVVGTGGKQVIFHLVARSFGTSFPILLFGRCGRSTTIASLREKMHKPGD